MRRCHGWQMRAGQWIRCFRHFYGRNRVVIAVDVLSKRQGRARLSLHFVCLSRRRRWLCNRELFMALVWCGRKFVVGALVWVALGERNGKRRTVLRHGV